MKFVPAGLLISGLLLIATARAQMVVYSFGSTSTPTSNATLVASHLTAGAFSGNLGSPGTGGSSPLFTTGSGGSYFTASGWTGSSPGTNYLEFTLTPDAGYQLSASSLSFGYRASSTGPTAYVVRSSADGFITNLLTGTLTNDSAWHGTGNLSLTMSSLGGPTTWRLYASGASAGAGTLRVDDVTLNGSVSAIPEPSTYAVLLGVIALAGAMRHRGRRSPHVADGE